MSVIVLKMEIAGQIPIFLESRRFCSSGFNHDVGLNHSECRKGYSVTERLFLPVTESFHLEGKLAKQDNHAFCSPEHVWRNKRKWMEKTLEIIKRISTAFSVHVV